MTNEPAVLPPRTRATLKYLEQMFPLWEVQLNCIINSTGQKYRLRMESRGIASRQVLAANECRAVAEALNHVADYLVEMEGE